ncbi:unnamed protein product [Trichogramma brassicae]|uniref:Uncharacterized protein n=1 Tax=Trichogramma brassicae TaxID=86971 RepID=A0A6H5J4D5_9HYME|nr:unnamed protein product [Trichogramma brassicae]
MLFVCMCESVSARRRERELQVKKLLRRLHFVEQVGGGGVRSEANDDEGGENCISREFKIRLARNSTLFALRYFPNPQLLGLDFKSSHVSWRRSLGFFTHPTSTGHFKNSLSELTMPCRFQICEAPGDRHYRTRPAFELNVRQFYSSGTNSPAQAPRVAATQGPQVAAAAAARGSWRRDDYFPMEHKSSRVRITSGGYFLPSAATAAEEHNTMMKQRTATTSFEKSAAVSCLRCCTAECPQCLRPVAAAASTQLHEAVKTHKAPSGAACCSSTRKRLIEFVVRTGYKDEEPSTAELFEAHQRFHVIYNKSRLARLQVACQYGFDDVVSRLLELGQDPNYLAHEWDCPPLHYALIFGHKRVIESLLRCGADPDLTYRYGPSLLHAMSLQRADDDVAELFFEICDEKHRALRLDLQDQFGNTPLHLALLNVHKKMVELLLRRGASPHLANKEGSTPLQIICTSVDCADDLAEMFFELCNEQQLKVIVDARDKSGKTPLRLALECGNKKAIELLLRSGADPNLVDKNGSTLLHLICEKGKNEEMVEILKIFLGCRVVRVDARDKLGRTPLHITVGPGYGSMTALLLRRGASPNVADKGLTPLHTMCARHRDDSYLKSFLDVCDQVERWVRIDARDQSGRTPLQLAVNEDNKKVARLLLRRGADPDLVDAKGSTLLHAICQKPSNYQYAFLKILFEVSDELGKSVDVDARDGSGRTALRLTLDFYGCTKATELLLKRGADPSLAVEDGSTLLHVISRSNSDNINLVKVLFEMSDKLEIDARDKRGDTPLVLALAHRQKRLASLLLTKGANPNLACNKGLTPLHLIGCYTDDGDNFIETFFVFWDKQQRTARVDVKDEMGGTPLLRAVKLGKKKVVRKLLERGANPNLANDDGVTPLHLIGKYTDDDDLLQMFFDNWTARVDVQDNVRSKSTPRTSWVIPLHLALDDRHYKVAELLLRRGVDINIANNDGSTPLHIIGRKKIKVDFVKLFFKICDEKRQTAQIDARDKLGRTPLEWAVASLLPNTFDVLLDNGADLTGFVFPTKSQFDASFNWKGDDDLNGIPSRLIGNKFRTRSKFKQASNALVILERLEKSGYELDRGDALTIMKFFAEHGYLESFAELENESGWYRVEEFATEAKKIMINPRWSLYELIETPIVEASKRLVYEDCFRFAHEDFNWPVPEYHYEAAHDHLSAKLLRKFLRRWTLDPFIELIHYRLPILCCDMIIDNLNNEDLCNICLAAEGQTPFVYNRNRRDSRIFAAWTHIITAYDICASEPPQWTRAFMNIL